MKALNYFKDWWRFIDHKKLFDIIKYLDIEYKTKKISPDKGDIFKVFNLCDYNNLKVVIIGKDPYPQKGVATGIAFGNNKEPISPSLDIIRDCFAGNEYLPIKFDITLESWVKQGVLLLNSALTVEENIIGSHTMLWRPFMSYFIKELSITNPGLIFILLGEQAETFEPYIDKYCYVLKDNHPAYYARLNKRMSPNVFNEANKILLNCNNTNIKWYERNYK